MFSLPLQCSGNLSRSLTLLSPSLLISGALFPLGYVPTLPGIWGAKVAARVLLPPLD